MVTAPVKSAYTLASAASQILTDSVRGNSLALPAAAAETAVYCREAQNALRAAIQSSEDAIFAGSVLNRISKLSDGKNLKGGWTAPAQDALRSAILFAGAGLDRALKRLVEETLPVLIDDPEVRKKFEVFAQNTITDSSDSVSPKELVRLLLGAGQSPRDVVLNRWMNSLAASSAQSVERVEEIASALGVVDRSLRSRIKPGSSGAEPLRLAFEARNQIAHELDVTKPAEDVRKPLERIRSPRSVGSVEKNVAEMLTVTQEVINDVARRVASS